MLSYNPIVKIGKREIAIQLTKCSKWQKNKSNFLKETKPKKSLNYKNMQIYCKHYKNTELIRFQKKVVLISKNITKEKSKYAISLTERTFITNWRQIWSKKWNKSYPKFFSDRCYKRKWRLTAQSAETNFQNKKW